MGSSTFAGSTLAERVEEAVESVFVASGRDGNVKLQEPAASSVPATIL